MKSADVSNIVNYIKSANPINSGWTERRRVFELNGDIYLVTDNFPHWTATQLREWLRELGIKTFVMEVEVTLTKDLSVEANHLPAQSNGHKRTNYANYCDDADNHSRI